MADLPSNLSRYYRWYVSGLLFVLVTLSAVGLGLRLSPWLAVRLGRAPVNAQTFPMPEASIPSAWQNALQHSNESLYVATGVLASETLASDLVDAARRGVRVTLVLPLRGNESPERGIRKWLAEHTSPMQVVFDPVPFSGTTALWDEHYVILTNQDLSVTNRLETEGGHWVFFDDASFYAAQFVALKKQLNRCHQ